MVGKMGRKMEEKGKGESGSGVHRKRSRVETKIREKERCEKGAGRKRRGAKTELGRKSSPRGLFEECGAEGGGAAEYGADIRGKTERT